LTKAQEVSTNSWYVGNTKAGEWIQFKKVWLSEGHYRFTTNSVAESAEKTVALQLNGETLSSGVVIPHNANNQFELVHLGYAQLATGYYDIKLVFETGDVNCDMIFIKKHASTSFSVLSTDTEIKIVRDDGPHILAIGGPINSRAQLAKGGENDDSGVWRDRNNNLYSREQMMHWYKQSIYAYMPTNSNDDLDTYVSEQVEAKVDVIFSHGRGDRDFVNEPEDRAFRHSDGAFSCRMLKNLCEAINRNQYAKDNLKIAWFVDNAVFGSVYNNWCDANGLPRANFRYHDPNAAAAVWEYMMEPFFDNIPRDMVFESEPGFVPVQLWTSNARMDYEGVPAGQRKIKEFLVDVSDRCFEKFGFRPAWILSGDFFSNDTRLRDTSLKDNPPYIKGVQAWFSWNGAITSMATCPVTGRKYAFALNGGRLPFNNCWYNDWNPQTKRGTRVSGNSSESHKSALDANGNPVIRPIFERAIAENAEWTVLESWSDWAEGSIWYRSDQKESAFPNQHMALVREFADRTSESIVLEAEGCDEYYNTTKGNRGGTYRVNWYAELEKDFWDANMDIDLDIYRPLHKLDPIVPQGKPDSPTSLVQFSAGNKDIWGINETGRIYAHQIDGIPANKWATGSISNAKRVELGGGYAWILLSSGLLGRAELGQGETQTHRSTIFINSDASVGGNTTVSPLDFSLSVKEAWVVNTDGKVYTRPLSASKPWKQLPGLLKAIAAENQSVWGITPTDSIVRMNSESQLRWDTIPNPHKLIKLSGGNSEVWGVNAKNEVYRINSSGDGKWQFVAGGYNNVSVGMDYVWLQDLAGNFYNMRMTGFETTSVFPTYKETEVGIRNVELAVKDVRIYPTPFTDKLNIEIMMDKSSQLQINLYDLNGQLFSGQTVPVQQGNNSISLDNVSNLKQGIYLLSITSNDYSKTFKVVKTQ
jgi:hypothetical protein